MKKLQSAALLLDFWLGQGVRGGGNTRSGVADALHRPAGCLRQAVSLRSAVPPEQRRPSQKDTQPCGREQERPSGRVARSVTARWRGCALACACHTAFLTLARRFLIFSQVLRSAILSQAFREYSKVLPSDMLLHWRTLLDGWRCFPIGHRLADRHRRPGKPREKAWRTLPVGVPTMPRS